MMRGHGGELDAPRIEESVGADKERVGTFAHQCRERRIDVAAGAGVEDLQLHTHSVDSRLYFAPHGLGASRIGRIDECGHTRGAGHQLMQ
jgi:hypothetical protein